MRFQALLFDLGNVLVEVDWNRAFALWSRASGVPAQALARRFKRAEAYEAHECGALSDAAFFATLREDLQVDLDDDVLREGWNAILGEPYPGVPALLRRLPVPAYAFSNTNVAHATHWRPKYRTVLAPLREVFVSCELGARKPERKAFEDVVRRIGAPPGRIAFFDDLEENVAGAQAAGLAGFHVRTPEQLARIVDEALS
jgi:putative hydrolase of the HAD superfamily